MNFELGGFGVWFWVSAKRSRNNYHVYNQGWTRNYLVYTQGKSDDGNVPIEEKRSEANLKFYFENERDKSKLEFPTVGVKEAGRVEIIIPWHESLYKNRPKCDCGDVLNFVSSICMSSTAWWNMSNFEQSNL
ncbi:hypothetical protein CEXT_198881 [Caerostris extrusa]|uniref:Uncharacterized protein n=1 Tax=Caerostris extrusa TaxID=172846 RepID=A0AAV4WKJ4_CAEEX|nr:hypothetical protein CEXT_198881 [Caerostris extrusa]